MPDAIPSLPGLLGPQDVRATAAAIARAQEPSGAIPWFPGGHVDPWDHVECAMALLVGGEVDAAERVDDPQVLDDQRVVAELRLSLVDHQLDRPPDHERGEQRALHEVVVEEVHVSAPCRRRRSGARG